jgi:deoxyribodipyrimidine photo-lyase
MRGIWWIKRDYRLSDNACICEGLESCKELVPFFCWEPEILHSPDFSIFHLQAQWQGLTGLRRSLQKRQSDLLEDYNEICTSLKELHLRFPFQIIFSHQETGNLISFERDLRVRKWCLDNGVIWKEINASSVMRGGNADTRRVRLRQEDYRKEKVLSVPENLKFPSSFTWNKNPLGWGDLTKKTGRFAGVEMSTKLQKVSEKAAWETLGSFLSSRAQKYSGGISSPNLAFQHGSRLSSHLAWGTISLRTVFNELENRIMQLKEQKDKTGWLRSLRAFQSRLFWRDHFIQRLEAFPNLENLSLNPAYRNLEYEDSSTYLDAWLEGKTGYPMVDACMRCLQSTGFLNFRMRAMVVSFACYGLHLSWQKIHAPLAQIFLDYEPGIHLPQLQMQAGVIGFNAIRVYSPSKQFLDQDPDGHFVRKWIPELENRTSLEIANFEKCRLDGYNKPIVNLNERSKEMKSRIFEIRKSSYGKERTSEILQKHGSKRGSSSRKRLKDNPNQLALFS